MQISLDLLTYTILYRYNNIFSFSKILQKIYSLNLFASNYHVSNYKYFALMVIQRVI